VIGHPSVVTSTWKSTAHTRLGASAITVGGVVELSWPLCPALWRPEPSLAPKALYFLVIDCPALRVWVVLRGPQPASGMVLGVVAPRPHRGVQIVWGGPDRRVALGGSRRTEITPWRKPAPTISSTTTVGQTAVGRAGPT
jgi:hypothetical protein